MGAFELKAGSQTPEQDECCRPESQTLSAPADLPALVTLHTFVLEELSAESPTQKPFQELSSIAEPMADGVP